MLDLCNKSNESYFRCLANNRVPENVALVDIASMIQSIKRVNLRL